MYCMFVDCLFVVSIIWVIYINVHFHIFIVILYKASGLINSNKRMIENVLIIGMFLLME